MVMMTAMMMAVLTRCSCHTHRGKLTSGGVFGVLLLLLSAGRCYQTCTGAIAVKRFLLQLVLL